MASGVSGSAARRQRTFVAELRDAVSLRATLLVVGVLLLQLGFIVSYVGALHHPRPHLASLAVIAPQQEQPVLVQKLNALPGTPLHAGPLPSEADARRRIADQRLYSALVVDPSGTRDRLLVATARSAALATAIERTVLAAESAEHRTVQVVDTVPLASGDGSGLSSFYLAIGWCVGGYLVASILGISAGTRPANASRATIRLAVLALYSVLAGLGGAVAVGPVLNALPGGILALWGVGALLVFAVGAFTMAVECLFGIVGIGLAVLIFVILGNPSAGGVYPPPLLPPFWRAIGPWLPNGAGTSLARSYSYFDGSRAEWPWTVLAVWSVVGIAITLASTLLPRTPRTREATR